MESHYVICFFLSGWKVHWTDSVSSVFLYLVCARVCVFTTLWLTLPCRHIVLVCVSGGRVGDNNTAVLCFSPWAAAGTSWSSGQVWWAGHWAAACGPAAAATPDRIGRHQSTLQPRHEKHQIIAKLPLREQITASVRYIICLSIGLMFTRWRRGTDYNQNDKSQWKGLQHSYG